MIYGTYQTGRIILELLEWLDTKVYMWHTWSSVPQAEQTIAYLEQLRDRLQKDFDNL